VYNSDYSRHPFLMFQHTEIN